MISHRRGSTEKQYPDTAPAVRQLLQHAFPARHRPGQAPQHRLAAGQQDKPDTGFSRFTEHAAPFCAGELTRRALLVAAMIRTRIAPRAVQIAPACDAANQKRRDMQTVLCKRGPALCGFLACAA